MTVFSFYFCRGVGRSGCVRCSRCGHYLADGGVWVVPGEEGVWGGCARSKSGVYFGGVLWQSIKIIFNIIFTLFINLLRRLTSRHPEPLTATGNIRVRGVRAVLVAPIRQARWYE